MFTKNTKHVDPNHNRSASLGLTAGSCRFISAVNLPHICSFRRFVDKQGCRTHSQTHTARNHLDSPINLNMFLDWINLTNQRKPKQNLELNLYLLWQSYLQKLDLILSFLWSTILLVGEASRNNGWQWIDGLYCHLKGRRSLVQILLRQKACLGLKSCVWFACSSSISVDLSLDATVFSTVQKHNV